MTLCVTFHGGTRYDIASNGHTVITDQPVDDGGMDAGMSPVDLFVGSLTACVAYFVGRYCARHQILCESLTVEADWTMAEQPHRVGTIALRIHLPETLNPSERERLLRVAHGCTVHQSLVVPAQVEIALTNEAGTGSR
ncbi:MAG: OsmC family protein [Nitrospirae bacterium]|nr:OsmC family protein [Nitrospirota bacterium]